MERTLAKVAEVVHGRLIGADAIENRAHDRLGVLAARVVVGDDDVIGPFGRDRTHRRALARIALAAASEYAPELAVREGADGLEHAVEAVRCMRVVDDDRGRAGRRRADDLETARRRRTAGERRARVAQREIPRDQRAERDEEILRVEGADQRRA